MPETEFYEFEIEEMGFKKGRYITKIEIKKRLEEVKSDYVCLIRLCEKRWDKDRARIQNKIVLLEANTQGELFEGESERAEELGTLKKALVDTEAERISYRQLYPDEEMHLRVCGSKYTAGGTIIEATTGKGTISDFIEKNPAEVSANCVIRLIQENDPEETVTDEPESAELSQ